MNTVITNTILNYCKHIIGHGLIVYLNLSLLTGVKVKPNLVDLKNRGISSQSQCKAACECISN
jgi:hypothetical protein